VPAEGGELGYRLRRAAWHAGYATEGSAATLRTARLGGGAGQLGPVASGMACGNLKTRSGSQSRLTCFSRGRLAP
jgi:hypothetical protein